VSRATKTSIEYDADIEDAVVRKLDDREDVFLRACNTTDRLRWSVVHDARGRPHYQLRKYAQPEVCYVQLVEDELERYSDEDIVAAIIHGEKPCIDADYLSRRVDRWIERLGGLCEQVIAWTAERPHCSAQVTETPQREEDLLQAWGVPSRNVPELVVECGDRSVRFVPSALFIVGANGRVDVFHSAGAVYNLVDRAPDEAPERDWQIAIPEGRQYLQAFTREIFFRLLDQTQ